ncbi:hypothetical protein ACSSS7_002369 [Eimeria intestinalis]
MQATEAYVAYRDPCSRLRSETRLSKLSVETAFLANLSQDTARDTRDQATDADRLVGLEYVACFAITFYTLVRAYPGEGEQRPQDVNTLTLNDNFYAPSSADAPPASAKATRQQPRVVAQQPASASPRADLS